ncbi:hypothetical protein LCGC14_0204720 [marine sediment metagenome]|uniref:Uncharacterized protein n=1 Tax=marine sediment metagenome TaxID=412755 RepID=A0A0F9UM42_9ZZZZ
MPTKGRDLDVDTTDQKRDGAVVERVKIVAEMAGEATTAPPPKPRIYTVPSAVSEGPLSLRYGAKHGKTGRRESSTEG